MTRFAAAVLVVLASLAVTVAPAEAAKQPAIQPMWEGN